MVKIRYVKNSFGNLYDGYARVQEEVFTLKGVITGDIDEVKNRIVFGVADKGALEKVKNLLDEFKIPADTYDIKITSPIKLNATVRDRFIPIKSGS